MFEIELPENLIIFLDNLCLYYVSFDLLSLVTILFTWWYCTFLNSSAEEKYQDDFIGEDYEDYRDTKNLIDNKMEDDDFPLEWKEEAILNVKFMRHKALVNELKSRLTTDELEQEKKTEKMQLQKIFQLLQEQEDKFQVSSMEQLEDQLHLYIN